MIKNTLLNMLAAALLTGLTFVSGSAMAQTPDRSTPANEGVCNVLQASGVSPGLYGLCVAYCEAQDLDSFSKEPPNSKILGNYNKRKQASDPAMPCVKTPCPCWSGAEMAAITGDSTAGACVPGTNTLQIVDNSPALRFAEVDISSIRERCRYVDLNLLTPIVRSLSITPAEAQACYMEVQTACQSTGFPVP